MLDFIKKIYSDAFTNNHDAGLMAVWNAAIAHARHEMAMMEQCVGDVIVKVDNFVTGGEAPFAASGDAPALDDSGVTGLTPEVASEVAQAAPVAAASEPVAEAPEATAAEPPMPSETAVPEAAPEPSPVAAPDSVPVVPPADGTV